MKVIRIKQETILRLEAAPEDKGWKGRWITDWKKNQSQY